MDIIIDTKGQADLALKDRLFDSDDDDIAFEDIGIDPTKLRLEDDEKNKKKTIDRTQVMVPRKKAEYNYGIPDCTEMFKRSYAGDIDVEDFEREMGWVKGSDEKPSEYGNTKFCNVKSKDPLKEILEKSVIKPGFEQLETVPRYDVSANRLRKDKRKEREKTKGKNWFDLPATEMTDEIKHDLEIIQMRSVLDPKRFYKKNEIKVLPKYFHIGKVVDSPLDYYGERLTKKERKRTIVDELMGNAEFSKFNKRKYKEILDEKQKLRYKAHKHARKLKGKKK